MKLETVGRSMWRNFTEAKTEKCMITEKWRKRYHWTRGTWGRGKSSNKRTKKQQSFRDRQYTSRDAQKLRGRCYDGTNKDMSRYIHNGSAARGLLTINPSSYQLKRNQMPQHVRITEPLAFSPMHQKS